MSITTLIELVQDIEKAMNDYAAGWRNTDVLRIISPKIQEIQYRSDTMEGYWAGEAGQELPFDHGYVHEKLSSLTGEVDKLYSSRKHVRVGGIDEVKRQAMGECSRLRTYFGRPWLQRL
jgi:hypothetical protein